MNIRRPLATVVGAGLFMLPGCSSPVQEKPPTSASPADLRTAEDLANNKSLAIALGRQAFQKFESDIQDGKGRIAIVAGTCAVLLESQRHSRNIFITVPNYGVTDIKDPHGTGLVSIAVAYDPYSRHFVEGAVLVQDTLGDDSFKINTSAEHDLQTGSIQARVADVHLDPQGAGIIEDSSGEVVMTASSTFTGEATLAEFASTDFAQTHCRTTLHAGNQ